MECDYMTTARWSEQEFYGRSMIICDEQHDRWKSRIGLNDLDYAAHLTFRLGAKWLKSVMTAYERVFLLTHEDLMVIHKNLVTHYRKKGNLAKSIEYLEKVIEAEEGAKKSKLTLTLGELYCLDDNFDQAKSMFQSHLIDHPESIQAMVGLANICVKRKDDDNAIKHYEQVVEHDNQNHFVWYRLGILYDKRKDFLKATECLAAAIALDPNNIRYNQQLGFVYEEMDSHAAAIPYFKRVMELENER